MIWIYVLCASKSYELKIIVPSLLCSIRFGAYANNQNFLLHTRGENREEERKIFKNTFDWCFRVCFIEKLFLWSARKVIWEILKSTSS